MKFILNIKTCKTS